MLQDSDSVEECEDVEVYELAKINSELAGEQYEIL
jgi:hypothetical protein